MAKVNLPKGLINVQLAGKQKPLMQLQTNIVKECGRIQKVKIGKGINFNTEISINYHIALVNTLL
jgi:hypothetical protein